MTVQNKPLEERFFILTPTPTGEKEKTSHGTELQIYLDASGKRMMWSGNFPLPKLNDRIYVTMNGIGYATVKGFFESCGYVGVMTLPENPPERLKKQWEQDRISRKASGRPTPKWVEEGIGCQFGIEVARDMPESVREYNAKKISN